MEMSKSTATAAPKMRKSRHNEVQLEPIYVTVQRGCELTGLGATKFYELIAAGAVETIKIGNRRLIRYESLKRIGQSQVP